MLFAVATLAATLAVVDARPAGMRPTKRTTPVKRLSWTLANDYSGANFLSGWDVFVGTDAQFTHGEVNYVSNSALQYYDSGSNSTFLKVDDTTNVASGANRDSTRITSKAAVNENSLVIADFAHVPWGCATWPAFWAVGPNWPSGGEVDIFEGVNQNTLNQATLHTSPGCQHDSNVQESGNVLQANCDTNVNGNAGCGVQDTRTTSYGDGFNNNGGGVYAMQWDSDGISIFFFPRNSVPSDIGSNSPNPAGWGTPVGFWSFTSGQCASSFFNNLQLVFDITLCGDWAGQAAIYSQTCSGSCADQVATGSNFKDAYFQVNYIQTFTGA